MINRLTTTGMNTSINFIAAATLQYGEEQELKKDLPFTSSCFRIAIKIHQGQRKTYCKPWCLFN